MQAQPEIHHSDQGVRYAAIDYVAVLKKRRVEVSMAAVGHAEENGFAELIIRTIKEEEIDLIVYPDLMAAKLHLRRFIDDIYSLHFQATISCPVLGSHYIASIVTVLNAN